jgi:DNA-binding YbaB/EbfC family protein
MNFKGGMGNMLKQAQMMQAKLAKLQAEIAEKTAEGTAGGGMVKVVANGKNELVSVHIDKEAANPEDIEMLEEMVLAAANQALQNIHQLASNAMKQATGGMGLPPGIF